MYVLVCVGIDLVTITAVGVNACHEFIVQYQVPLTATIQEVSVLLVSVYTIDTTSHLQHSV